MSERRLTKYLEKRCLFVEKPRQFKPVIFSDSKGNYIQEWANNEFVGRQIEWRTYRGATTRDLVTRIGDSLNTLISRHGKIHIYLWSGTCDLTVKDGRYIKLRPNPDHILGQLTGELMSLEESATNRGFKITLLNVPNYSLVTWNSIKGHPNPTQFTADDIELRRRVQVINTVIDDINLRRDVRSPKFNADTERPHKHKNGLTQYTTNWSLYRDGVHPGPLLSQVWMRSICVEIQKGCF